MKKVTQHAGIRILIAPAILFICLFINSCMNTNNPMNSPTMNPTTGTQGANDVYIQNIAFSPAVLTVSAGTTVTWTNKDAMTHTVTSDSTLFNSGNIVINGVYSYTFATVGTYSYHCSIHPSMTAKVIVSASMTPSGY